MQKFHEMPFLKQNFKLEEPEALKAKKDDITNKLGSLMPTSRLTFWKYLSVNNKKKDLTVHLKLTFDLKSGFLL